MYGEGEFCWIELVTTDEGESLPFYKELLGLGEETIESDDGSAYYMLKEKSNYVAGLYEASENKSFWSSYVAVKNADKFAAKVEKLGGFIEQEPIEVMDAGRFATFADPTGGTFSIWQPGHHKGSTAARNAPGMFGWNELATNDTDEAIEFYGSLFGWKAKTKKHKDFTYSIMTLGSTKVAGIKEMGEDYDAVSSHWLVYFNVKDVDKALAKVEELGGQVFHKAFDLPEVGRYSVVADPTGGILGLLSPKGGSSKSEAPKKEAAKKDAGKKEPAAKKAPAKKVKK